LPLPRNQIKKVRGIIYNCRVTFNEEESLTFLTFVKVLNGLEDGCIVKSFALNLYKTVLTILH
jgi:hypothetical protein